MASEPLRLTDLFGDRPADTIAVDVYGDGVWMLLDHLTMTEAEERLRRQPWWRPELTLHRCAIRRTWVTFDVHAEACDFPEPDRSTGDGCDCTWDPDVTWHRRWVRPNTPGAVAVTLVQLPASASRRMLAPASGGVHR